MNLLYVAIGGAVGSTARYLLAGAINQARAPHAAAGTFAVNVIGCFTLRNPPHNQRTSRRSGELDSRVPARGSARRVHDIFVLRVRNVMLREAQFLQAAFNAGGQVFLGLPALSAGYALVRLL